MWCRKHTPNGLGSRGDSINSFRIIENFRLSICIIGDYFFRIRFWTKVMFIFYSLQFFFINRILNFTFSRILYKGALRVVETKMWEAGHITQHRIARNNAVQRKSTSHSDRQTKRQADLPDWAQSRTSSWRNSKQFLSACSTKTPS